MEEKGQIEIYQSSDGQTELKVTFDNDTVWLSQQQLSHLFERDRTVIGRHLRNIFKEGELDENMVCANFAHTTPHGGVKGKTQTVSTKFYNLDVIISVGYRIRSIRGTQFRQWASKRLKDYLIKGYSLNQKRLSQTDQEIKVLRSGIRIFTRAIKEKAREEGLEWLNQFTAGLKLLDDYDHKRLDSVGRSSGPVRYPSFDKYQNLIHLMKQKYLSDLFGLEKDMGFKSSISQIEKGLGTEDFYPTFEEKAAALLYLITKNHAFVDGNKRIAAACFLLFLKKNNRLTNLSGNPTISNDTLAIVTLFVATSKPEEMQIVKNLIISILNQMKELTK